jgi:branched-chain amino acid transport system permease protein
MERYISQIIDGLSTGALYGIIALALVLIFRSTDIVNFAQGEMAMFTTFICWSLLLWAPGWLAVLLALAIAFALGGLLEAVVVRRVEEGPLLNPVIVTLGLFAIFNSVALWRYGPIPKTFPSPFGNGTFRIGDVVVSHQSIGVLGAALFVALLLFLLFQYTKLGLALRATAQDRLAARLMGIRVGWMLTLGWALAALVGTIAGILVAPTLFLQPNMMQAALTFAFAGAVLGGLDNPWGALLGGMAVGVIENLAGTWGPIGSELKTVVAIAILIGILTFKPAGIFGKRAVYRV